MSINNSICPGGRGERPGRYAVDEATTVVGLLHEGRRGEGQGVSLQGHRWVERLYIYYIFDASVKRERNMIF